MDPLIARLNAVLQQETVLHQTLLDEAEGKRGAIIAGRLPEMEEILVREKEVLKKVEELEQERLALVAETCQRYDLPGEPFKIQSLLDRLGAEGEELAATRAALKDVLNRLRLCNRQNDELLKASIEHVNSFLKLLSRSANPNCTYNRKGNNTGNRSIFDRTA